jgi:hypothetical protein
VAPARVALAAMELLRETLPPAAPARQAGPRQSTPLFGVPA